MFDLFAETLSEALPVAFWGAVTVSLTVVGTVAEQLGIEHLGAGDMFIGLWLVGVGALMIYAGLFQAGATELLPRLRARME